jgi:S1/P1 nuclease
MRTSRSAPSILLACALPALAGFAVPAIRWNAHGHMTIAAIAWNHMAPAVRARAIQLLRDGPPLAQFADLIPANEAREEQDRQLFLAASTWADRIRATDLASHAYHHATWHYTDYYWREVNGRVEPVPTLAPDAENALERLPLLEKQLGSASADTTRAIALAWILHLVGDVHQPLHLSGRVTAEEPEGDKGGNTFRLQGQPTNLHAFWDNALDLLEPPAGAAPVAYADRLASLVERDVPVGSIPAAQLTASFDAWGRESLDLAQHEVYVATMHSGDAPSAAYMQNAAKIAERRVALAGYRLAALLNRVLR